MLCHAELRCVVLWCTQSCQPASCQIVLHKLGPCCAAQCTPSIQELSHVSLYWEKTENLKTPLLCKSKAVCNFIKNTVPVLCQSWFCFKFLYTCTRSTKPAFFFLFIYFYYLLQVGYIVCVVYLIVCMPVSRIAQKLLNFMIFVAGWSMGHKKKPIKRLLDEFSCAFANVARHRIWTRWKSILNNATQFKIQ